MDSDRFEKRREALRRTLRAEDAGALLVSTRSNVHYLTGFTGDDSMLLIAPERAVMITDGRYTTQIEQECPGLEMSVRPVGQAMMAAVAEVVDRLGSPGVAFESTDLTVADFDDLRNTMPSVSFRGVRGWVEELRAIKDESEVTAIREAIAIAEQAFEAVRSSLRAGQSEKEVADAIESEVRSLGASAASFPPIVAVGANAALPHHQSGEGSRIGDGEFVLVDWGATGRLYKSDLTRVLVTGKVTSEFAEIYRAVLAAQQRAIDAIRPGVKAEQVDAEARSALEAVGLDRFFPHGLGHGIGLDIHEDPRLRRGSEEVLAAGMVVTVEPGVYLPHWGGIRIEDDVLVTPEGREVLTHLPKTLDSVAVGIRT